VKEHPMTDLPATHERLLAAVPLSQGARIEGASISYGHDGT
jgi:hypothetical protein